MGNPSPSSTRRVRLLLHGLHNALPGLVEETHASPTEKVWAWWQSKLHRAHIVPPDRLFSAPLLFSGTVWAQGGGIDTSTVPEGFRPYVHLLGSAEVIAPPDGPDWRSMEIKDYDPDRKKYRELEEMVLAVWPSVQIITVMLDTLRPTFLSGIESVPTDTLRAHREEVKDGRAQAKADRKEERKEKKAGRKKRPQRLLRRHLWRRTR